MLNCDGNENSKEKTTTTTTTTTFVISELRFPLYRAREGGVGGGGEYSTKCYTGRLRPDRPIYYYVA